MQMASELEQIETITTSTFLDRLAGGVPRGRITEVWGDSGLGKSTLCLQIIAEAQRQGLKCLWADVEYAYETKYAESLGIANSELSLIRERGAEEILDGIGTAVEEERFDLVVLDSIGGLTPRAENEKGSGEKVIGGQASLVARFCRKIVPTLSITGTALIVINHSFVDIMSGAVKTSGGAKLAYHKSLSIRLKSAGLWIKQGDQIIGKKITAEISKDKCFGREKKTISADLLFGSGFSASGDLLDLAMAKGMITKEGGSYFFLGKKVAYGLPKMRKWLEANAEKVKNLL